MSAAAQREDSNGDEGLLVAQANGTEGPQNALRQLAAERLAAHRNRRASMAAAVPQASARRDAAVPSSHAAGGPQVRPNVRDAVAARYRQSPSYQEFLAAEAERALEKAQAEAEVAARNALAVAEAQRRLLDEIDQWNQPAEPQQLFVVETHAAAPVAEPTRHETPRAARRHREPAPMSTEPVAAAPLKIQLYADLPPVAMPPSRGTHARLAPEELEELGELDGEIAFRMAPEFEEHIVETLPIQANIIEFPRQLVASRKARPRLAEGPLREDGTPEPQLRIFEVEPEQVSTAPELEPAVAPEWQSMVLAGTPSVEPDFATYGAAQTEARQAFDVEHNISPMAAPQIFAAPISRRMMAILVDAVCIATGFVGFAALTVKLCGPSLHEIPLPALGLAAAVALPVFTVLYQMLFFCFNEATPGMVYARLGLCTFAETNPTRREVRRRLWATAVAVSPLGLGMLWMALDPDRLGWHDRISRMYPRAY
jgi:uncharacterized RDD family membrane protein YckC